MRSCGFKIKKSFIDDQIDRDSLNQSKNHDRELIIIVMHIGDIVILNRYISIDRDALIIDREFLKTAISN